jgi:hypothetical protein
MSCGSTSFKAEFKSVAFGRSSGKTLLDGTSNIFLNTNNSYLWIDSRSFYKEAAARGSCCDFRSCVFYFRFRKFVRFGKKLLDCTSKISMNTNHRYLRIDSGCFYDEATARGSWCDFRSCAFYFPLPFVRFGRDDVKQKLDFSNAP